MKSSPPNIVPLSRAVLCMDCTCVTDGINKCAHCGSKAVYSLPRFMEQGRVAEVVRLEQMIRK